MRVDLRYHFETQASTKFNYEKNPIIDLLMSRKFWAVSTPKFYE